jgi:hypothetical protein
MCTYSGERGCTRTLWWNKICCPTQMEQKEYWELSLLHHWVLLFFLGIWNKYSVQTAKQALEDGQYVRDLKYNLHFISMSADFCKSVGSKFAFRVRIRDWVSIWWKADRNLAFWGEAVVNNCEIVSISDNFAALTLTYFNSDWYS